jgi:hypothetical protein
MAVITKSKLFPVRLWLLTTIIVGPILLCFGSALYDSTYFNKSANLGIIFLFIPFGLFFSLPTFIVVSLTHSLLSEKIATILLKWLLICVAVIGVLVTFSLIGGYMAKTYSLFYSAAVIVSGLILLTWKT